jgi:diacylglycerol kinase family enzyme
MRVTALLNPASGPRAFWRRGEGPRRIENAFRDVGVAVDLQVVDGQHLAERTRQAASSASDVVAAGGGDGTISTVAGMLAGGAKPLGVLPLGTWNHFARDLGIPLRPEEAVRTIAAGHARAIDVGEVNGHVFINNSSIGAYPHVAKQREELRQRFGGRKWLAFLVGLRAAFRRFPLLQVRVKAGGRSVESTTPLLFVGNNRYEMSFLSVQGRLRLDHGEVCLYLVKAGSRWALARLALRLLFGHLEQAEDFEARCVAELWVETRRRRLKVAKDGDILSLRPPLYYRSRPGALRVLVPG